MGEFGDLPEDVAVLLDTFVDSLSSLELLIAVSREPDRTWSAEQAAAHLGIAPSAAQRELDRCVRLGLMVHDGGGASSYHFGPVDEARADAVRQIVEYHRTHRVGAINHVASRVHKRIQALADAFRLGRRRGDE